MYQTRIDAVNLVFAITPYQALPVKADYFHIQAFLTVDELSACYHNDPIEHVVMMQPLQQLVSDNRLVYQKEAAVFINSLQSRKNQVKL